MRRHRVLVLRRIGREQRLVGAQQRAADAPDDVAERALLLGVHAAEHDAGAGLDLLHLDAGLLLERLEHVAIEVGVVRRIDDHLALTERRTGERDRRGGEEQARSSVSAWSSPDPVEKAPRNRIQTAAQDNGKKLSRQHRGGGLHAGARRGQRGRDRAGCIRGSAGRRECPPRRRTPSCRCGSPGCAAWCAGPRSRCGSARTCGARSPIRRARPGTTPTVTVGENGRPVGNIAKPSASKPARSAADRRAWRASTAGRPSSLIMRSASRNPRISDTGGVNGVSPLSSEVLARRKSKKKRGMPCAASITRIAFSLTAAMASPGGHISDFCEAVTTTSAPQSSMRISTPPTPLTRIDHQQRLGLAQHRADRREIGDHAGRAFIVDDDDGAIALRLDARRDRGGVRHLAPRDLQAVERDRQAFGDRREALAELPVLDHQHGVAGREHIDQRGFHAAGARGAEQEDVMPRAEHGAQRAGHLFEDGAEFRPAMRQHRQRHRGAHALGDRGGSGHAEAVGGGDGRMRGVRSEGREDAR